MPPNRHHDFITPLIFVALLVALLCAALSGCTRQAAEGKAVVAARVDMLGGPVTVASSAKEIFKNLPDSFASVFAEYLWESIQVPSRT